VAPWRFSSRPEQKVRSLVLAGPVNPWSDFGMERIRFLAAAGWMLLPDGKFPFRHLCIVVALRRMYGDPERIRGRYSSRLCVMLMRPGRVHNLLNVLPKLGSDVGACAAPSPGTSAGTVDLGKQKTARLTCVRRCSAKAPCPFETALLPGWGIWHLKKSRRLRPFGAGFSRAQRLRLCHTKVWKWATS